MAQSRHATGSARTRRSLDNQRDGPFSTVYRAGAFEAATGITRITPNRKRHTPCYGGELQRDDIPVPEVLRAD